jgi:hypothetical protein
MAYLATVESDLRRGNWIDPKSGKIALKNYANDWLSERAGLSLRTVELNEYLLNNHVFPTLGDANLAALTPSKIRNWNAELASSHASTASKAYRLLSTIMKTAVGAAGGLVDI